MVAAVALHHLEEQAEHRPAAADSTGCRDSRSSDSLYDFGVSRSLQDHNRSHQVCPQTHHHRRHMGPLVRRNIGRN